MEMRAFPSILIPVTFRFGLSDLQNQNNRKEQLIKAIIHFRPDLNSVNWQIMQTHYCQLVNGFKLSKKPNPASETTLELDCFRI